MNKKFLFKTLLQPIFIGLLVFSFMGDVWGVEYSDLPADNATGDSEWTLIVDGAVYETLNLTLSELVAMPKSTVIAELYCYEKLVTSGSWTGVQLGYILEKVGYHPQATDVTFYAADGYIITLNITLAMREDVIIAYELDGIPLFETLRLVVPGENGAFWISMITKATLEEEAKIPELQTTLILVITLTIISAVIILTKAELGKPLHTTN
jgi:DMSO/TMAO reductase YedYZ molybdopterin-dependent catalytic subunit